MKRVKGTVTITVVVLLCTAMLLLLSLGTVSAAIKDPKATYDLSISFLSPDGTCVADAFGLTYTVMGEPFADPTAVYGEAYWGTYPLYLPGHDTRISVTATYTGKAEEVALKLVTEAYPVNLDGSNGSLVNTQTHEFTAVDNVPTYVDASFTVPFEPKGLYRFTAKLYSAPKSAKKPEAHEELLMTTEAIFCPPPAQ